MKLLICTTEFYPYGAGIANVVYNVVIQLKKMGVECTVCSPPDCLPVFMVGYGIKDLISVQRDYPCRVPEGKTIDSSS